MVEIGVKGKVLTGKYKDWFVLAEPTEEFAGKDTSYYLFIGREDPKRGYDSWCTTYEDLVSALEGMGEIEWLDS